MHARSRPAPVAELSAPCTLLPPVPTSRKSRAVTASRCPLAVRRAPATRCPPFSRSPSPPPVTRPRAATRPLPFAPQRLTAVQRPLPANPPATRSTSPPRCSPSSAGVEHDPRSCPCAPPVLSPSAALHPFYASCSLPAACSRRTRSLYTFVVQETPPCRLPVTATRVSCRSLPVFPPLPYAALHLPHDQLHALIAQFQPPVAAARYLPLTARRESPAAARQLYRAPAARRCPRSVKRRAMHTTRRPRRCTHPPLAWLHALAARCAPGLAQYTTTAPALAARVTCQYDEVVHRPTIQLDGQRQRAHGRRV
ncbi:hypothetical protein GGX14DRAFT_566528 [Mycena pura]|uniref:Uncharacterized protein n=1 Tax=Mycena pura TaxID=153505 RepID=A0AAD6VC56_9AGAR|nr:hypothetical protein GGX14DRAFT_566528 [Mycena pura]